MTDKKNTQDENKDPFEDKDNIPRSFPRTEDWNGTPDTQPDQPAEALGVGQVSADSLTKEREKLRDLADKRNSSEKRSGLVQVTEEEKAKANAEIKDGSAIEGGHSDEQKDAFDAQLEAAKQHDETASHAGEVPENAQSRTEENDTKKTAAAKKTADTKK